MKTRFHLIRKAVESACIFILNFKIQVTSLKFEQMLQFRQQKKVKAINVFLLAAISTFFGSSQKPGQTNI